jgi:hypothetical protein
LARLGRLTWLRREEASIFFSQRLWRFVLL